MAYEKVKEAIDAFREAMGDRHWVLILNPKHAAAENGFAYAVFHTRQTPPYIFSGMVRWGDLYFARIGAAAVEAQASTWDPKEDDDAGQPE